MNTEILTENEIPTIASLLKHGELVGLPTETVYGLAANGLDAKAVQKIFSTKGRPADNPLILHLGDATWITRYCKNIPPAVWTLTEHFWPGPLTLILDCQDTIPDIVTAGLSTVGVRCPNHKLALKTILEANLPLAAPSGNLSGKPSPTSAIAMLEDMNGKIPAILDGGPCDIGVESTILDVRNTPTLLRIGGISQQDLESVLKQKIKIDPALEKNNSEIHSKPLAPGMKYRHYAPEASVTVVQGKNSPQWILEHAEKGDGVICFDEYISYFPHCVTQSLGREKDFTTQAQSVFSSLRYFNQTTVQKIWSQCPINEGLGQAVAQRLEKAASYQIINLEDNP